MRSHQQSGYSEGIPTSMSLRSVTEATVTLVESLIIRRVGPELYKSTMTEFLKRVPAGPHPARFLETRATILTS